MANPISEYELVVPLVVSLVDEDGFGIAQHMDGEGVEYSRLADWFDVEASSYFLNDYVDLVFSLSLSTDLASGSEFMVELSEHKLVNEQVYLNSNMSQSPFFSYDYGSRRF